MHHYYLGGEMSVLLTGIRYYDGFTHRRQGLGNDGSGPDFDFLSPQDLEGSDYDFPSINVSWFAENIFNLSEKFSLTPGVRFEYIRTEADGYYKKRVEDLAGNILLDEKVDEQRVDERSFVFFGLGASYKQSEDLEIYANFSQNYRAVNFNDIKVSVGSLEVDPNMEDEKGYNLELGVRGNHASLFTYDITAFHLSYQDRIGTVLRTEPNPMFNNLVDRTFRYRTNVSDAQIYGIESFAEIDLYKLLVDASTKTKLALFSNLAFIQAEYTDSEERGIEGNDVELVPKVNFKAGLTFGKGNFLGILQFMHVGQQFSDATNAVITPTAIEGIIPSYQVLDLSMSYTFKKFSLESGINNLTNQNYFTRRATGYPGPGIIPSNGRSFYVTLGVDL
jgi:Fe(3+) dicitrate transport protein